MALRGSVRCECYSEREVVDARIFHHEAVSQYLCLQQSSRLHNQQSYMSLLQDYCEHRLCVLAHSDAYTHCQTPRVDRYGIRIVCTKTTRPKLENGVVLNFKRLRQSVAALIR
jgi:hypothetical protein